MNYPCNKNGKRKETEATHGSTPREKKRTRTITGIGGEIEKQSTRSGKTVPEVKLLTPDKTVFRSDRRAPDT